MTIKTILLEFKVKSPEKDSFSQGILDGLKKRDFVFHLVSSTLNENGNFNRSIYENSNSVLNVSWIKDSDISMTSRCTLNLEILGSNQWPSSNAELQILYDELRTLSQIEQSPNFIPTITRGTSATISPYLTTSDDRLIEYGIEKVLFDQKSAFQSIQIVKTVDHGNVLILDGAVNLAESDTEAYTHSLMNLPQDHDLYKEAEILILGGGDGGLLKCIMDETQAKHVTMVDLDEIVMEACALHMKSVCGNYLDKSQRKGDRYHVITGDALYFMEEHSTMVPDHEFDIIFGDLTDVPVDAEEEVEENFKRGSSVAKSSQKIGKKAHSLSSPTQEAWNFIEKVLQRALPMLKPETGRYYTHCNGKSVPTLLQKYEDMLDRFVVTKTTSKNGGNKKFKLKWTQKQTFVPSFMEVWVFYQVQLIDYDS